MMLFLRLNIITDIIRNSLRRKSHYILLQKNYIYIIKNYKLLGNNIYYIIITEFNKFWYLKSSLEIMKQ